MTRIQMRAGGSMQGWNGANERRQGGAPASGTDAVIRSVLGCLGPGGSRARLTTLILHRVHAVRDPLYPLEPDAEDFERRMRWIATWFNVLPALEAVRRLRDGTLPERALCITFDDGYADNVRVALPILQALGLHATFFIATAFLDGGRMFNDRIIESVRRARASLLDLSVLRLGVHRLEDDRERRAAIDALIGQVRYRPSSERDEIVAAIAEAAGADAPLDLMMSSDEIRELHGAGMGLGAHTHRHPILSALAMADAQREIVEGREVLQGLTGDAVALFAYPNGRPGKDYGAEHVSMVKRANFEAAFSTSWGVANGTSDMHQLPRFLPWDRDRYRFATRLAKNLASVPVTA